MTAEEQAIAAFEDAASRGFPNGDQIKLQMAIYTARAAAESDTPAVESVTYPDGTEATGVAPLPEQSPAQQHVPVTPVVHKRGKTVGVRGK